MGLGGCPLVRRRPASLWKSIMPGLTLKTQLFLIFRAVEARQRGSNQTSLSPASPRSPWSEASVLTAGAGYWSILCLYEYQLFPAAHSGASCVGFHRLLFLGLGEGAPSQPPGVDTRPLLPG